MNGYIPNIELWLSPRNEIKDGTFLSSLHIFWIRSFLYMFEFYNLKKLLMIAIETEKWNISCLLVNKDVTVYWPLQPSNVRSRTLGDSGRRGIPAI